MAIAVEGAARGAPWLWTAPTYDQVRIGWEESKRAAGGVARFTQDQMRALFPSGGSILYRSLDNPDNARGHTAAGVIVDEASVVKEEAWYEVIRPMLLDTGGSAWFLFTPAGRGWTWREFVNAGDRDDSAAWQVPTLGCRIDYSSGQLQRVPHPLENPYVSWPEIEQLWRTMPERTFRQEILAEFLEDEGSVFRNIAACMNAPRASAPEAHSGHRVVAGVDWGKQSDFTAISIGCTECRVELARDRFNKIDYAFQRQRLEALCRRWKVTSILAESNAMGEPVIEEMQRSGLPVRGFQTTATTKPPLIENLALALERAEWQFQADPVWTAELEAYERTMSTTTGRSSYSAPQGMHDDTVIARALMLWRTRGVFFG